MTELDPAGLGAAAKAVAAYVGWPPGFRRDAEAAVRAYLASLPPDAEKNPYGPASHTSADTAWDEGYAEGFAAGRAAATPTPSDEEGWSPGIDDPKPPALGDIDTGEGWYQT